MFLDSLREWKTSHILEETYKCISDKKLISAIYKESSKLSKKMIQWIL